MNDFESNPNFLTLTPATQQLLRRLIASNAPQVQDGFAGSAQPPPLGSGMVLDSGSGAHSPPDAVQRHIAEQSRLAYLGQIACRD